jgi:hypothetical protein
LATGRGDELHQLYSGEVRPGLAEGRDRVTSDYVRVTELADLFAEARELSVETIIFDVEPLVPGVT